MSAKTRKTTRAKRAPAAISQRLKNLQYPAFAVDASNVVVGWNSDLEHLLAISRRTALGNKLALVIEARDPFGNRWDLLQPA